VSRSRETVIVVPVLDIIMFTELENTL